MRTVFTNHMCAHVWASMSQDFGRSNNGAVHFAGPRIYTYSVLLGVHMPGTDVWLVNADNYSPTSGHHRSIVQQAIPGSYRMCPNLDALDVWFGSTNPDKASVLRWAHDTLVRDGCGCAMVSETISLILCEFGLRRSFNKVLKKARATIDRNKRQEARQKEADALALFREAIKPGNDESVIADMVEDHMPRHVRSDMRRAHYVNVCERVGLDLLRALKWANRKGTYGKRTLDRIRKRRRLVAARLEAARADIARAAESDDVTRWLAAYHYALANLTNWQADPAPLYDILAHAESHDNSKCETAHDECREIVTMALVVSADFYSATYHSVDNPDKARLMQETVNPYRLAYETIRDARRERRDAAHKAELYQRSLEDAERRDKWATGDTSIRCGFWHDADGGYLVRAVHVERDDHDAIIAGDLETSGGARVPLVHAIKAYHLATSCRDNKRAWQANGVACRVGHFRVHAIDTDGNIKAGCHRLTWPTMHGLAQALGV